MQATELEQTLAPAGPGEATFAMATTDPTKYGKPWDDAELDNIVSDYFAMLTDELAGRDYTKSKHSEILMRLIGRSHRSVEFKHQNISAVLELLCLPWIAGYKPKSNYQNAIFDAIDRHLSKQTNVLDDAPATSTVIPPATDIFVPPPKNSDKGAGLPARLQRLVRKFDPVERDRRNRALGRAGEAFVLEVERRQLNNHNRGDLAQMIRWVSDQDGDGAGYDISSYHPSGVERLIEVKTTNGGPRTPFFISRNEQGMAVDRPNEWFIYRVHLFNKSPRIFTLAPPLENVMTLRPESWSAHF